jgi:predicted  nucleic acid-binding Zn-ribbon protein
MVMQPLEITEIQKEIDRVDQLIKSLRSQIQSLEQEKTNLMSRLVAVRIRIQKSGIKY